VTRLRLLLRGFKCRLLIKHYRLRQAHPTAYIAPRSDISRDLTAGAYTYVGPGSMIAGTVSIGAYTMLGPKVMCLGDDHRFDLPGVPIVFSGRPNLRMTTIGRDVWIGAGSIILAGVQIGDGSIVAAGSVVSNDIPPCEIHGGVPNRKIRDRFATVSERDRHIEYLQAPPMPGNYAPRR
jgi:acetyltransferase-like isoleucine patch superfamily enzyme